MRERCGCQSIPLLLALSGGTIFVVHHHQLPLSSFVSFLLFSFVVSPSTTPADGIGAVVVDDDGKANEFFVDDADDDADEAVVDGHGNWVHGPRAIPKMIEIVRVCLRQSVRMVDDDGAESNTPE